ncbi:hypothetical protein A3J15_01615 [Candidatus Roizmanbacteria bacterium RIFCSPLOWO2_02_FULL_38_10]|uniref:Serine aminopeptidase S33 domain-containing protein n=1 Tax=Candidatus Roizmanbacteria bacterium RIFCSPLOWO2_02_FULL_38_10 TaxID=1802074 RepID=A0A1F7JN09_9BACT|nr:MAG: hypothetical protein A3J15_01615 [Candidatus Roizmanbacteria bacterium RIFCSPLOWO2_02_FULL_38_10]
MLEFRRNFNNHIKTRELFHNKKILTVIFPSAGTNIADFMNFINEIKVHSDIIFVVEGYYGLPITNLSGIGYEPLQFAKQFNKSYAKIFNRYKGILLCAQSIGTISALEFRKIYHGTNLKTIFLSPTLSEKNNRSYRLTALYLQILLKTIPGRFTLNLLRAYPTKIVIKYLLRKFLTDLYKPITAAGINSYFNCLYFITQFGLTEKQNIHDEDIFIIGDKDTYLNSYCNQDDLKKRKHTYIINGGHSLLQNNFKEVISLIQSCQFLKL